MSIVSSSSIFPFICQLCLLCVRRKVCVKHNTPWNCSGGCAGAVGGGGLIFPHVFVLAQTGIHYWSNLRVCSRCQHPLLCFSFTFCVICIFIFYLQLAAFFAVGLSFSHCLTGSYSLSQRFNRDLLMSGRDGGYCNKREIETVKWAHLQSDAGSLTCDYV